MKSEDRARLLTQWGFTFSIEPGKENWKHTKPYLLCNGKPMPVMRSAIKEKIIEETDENPYSTIEWGAWLEVAFLMAHGRL